MSRSSTPPRLPLVTGLLALLASQVLACAGGIQALYEDEKAAAMKSLSAPGDWSPDIRVRLSQDSLDDLVQVAVDEGLLDWKQTVNLQLPLGVEAKVKPSASVDSLELSPSSACEGCLGLKARLDGRAAWSAAGASGSVPFTARVGGTVSFELDKQPAGWALSGRVREVDQVQVGSAAIGNIDATSVLGGWISQALEQVEPVELGTFGGSELPLAGARLATSSGDLEVQLLSDLPDRQPVAPATKLRGAWELRIGTATLLGLARREAFETGPIAYDVAAIPTSLVINPGGFTLGLRLWKLEGNGWWRDYTVTGTVAASGGRLKLEPTGAEEGEKSQGAGLADPIALLAEGQILAAVEDGVRQSLPAGTAVQVGSRSVQARVSRVRGAMDHLVVMGTLDTSSSGGALPR